MPKTRHEFVKLEIRLMNDPRFFMLSEYDQLNYIKLICLAKQTHNRIRKDFEAIRSSFRSNQSTTEVQKSIKRIMSSFRAEKGRSSSSKDTLIQNRYYIWFRDWDSRYIPYGGVEIEVEKDKEKEIKNPDLEFYKKKTEEFKRQSQK